VLRPEVRNGVDETGGRAAARELLAALPDRGDAGSRPARRGGGSSRALTAETLVERPGCPNGHHVSELAWRPDKRLLNGGSWYCRACRREARRERGWS
jgi:hypothetical protein